MALFSFVKHILKKSALVLTLWIIYYPKIFRVCIIREIGTEQDLFIKNGQAVIHPPRP